jgi:hypothetical protein
VGPDGLATVDATAALLATVDTNQLDEATLRDLAAAVALCSVPVEFATVTVNERERGEWSGLSGVLESAAWGKSQWGHAVWGGPMSELAVLGESRLGEAVLAPPDSVFEQTLHVISNGSFPSPGLREQLSKGHRRLLRDAMTFEAHVRQRRHVLISADRDLVGPTTRPRRQQLQAVGRTWVLHPSEFKAKAAADELGELRSWTA